MVLMKSCRKKSKNCHRAHLWSWMFCILIFPQVAFLDLSRRGIPNFVKSACGHAMTLISYNVWHILLNICLLKSNVWNYACDMTYVNKYRMLGVSIRLFIHLFCIPYCFIVRFAFWLNCMYPCSFFAGWMLHIATETTFFKVELRDTCLIDDSSYDG